MQLSRIYSNRPQIFQSIDFNHGDHANRINVVLGEVNHPTDRKKDSHNLGKTTLLLLIDFLMLKGMFSEHFLQKHQDRFAGFTFFLEIALNGGGYATVRRSPAAAGRAGLTRQDEGGQDLSDLPDDDWAHPDLSIEEAITLLDAWLDLRMLKPYDYRKAITYFLRAQGDWGDELQLQKFQSGRDIHWKPFVAHLFGFKEEPVIKKYELDDSIQKLRQKQAEQQAEVQFKEEALPQLTAELAVLQQQVADVEAQLDAFQFDAEERRIVRVLISAEN